MAVLVNSGDTWPETGSTVRSIDTGAWWVIGLGIVLRLATYLRNRSLTNDELRYAEDITTTSYRAVLHHAGMPAPPLFKWSTKFVIEAFGQTEFGLRLLPLVFGLTSLVLFAALTARYLPRRGRLMALLLFAVSSALIYFSAELKPYAGDVAIALILLLGAPRLLGHSLTARDVIANGVIGAIAIWWSFPSVFVLSGVGGAAMIVAWTHRDRVRVAYTLALITSWTLSFGALYLFSPLRDATGSHSLRGFWVTAFMPFPPRTVADFKWYPDAFMSIFIDPGAFNVPGIAALAFLVGCSLMWQQRRINCLLLLSPFGFVLAASSLGKYPFAERLLLFILPICLIFIGAGADWLTRHSRMIAIPVVLMLFAPAVVFAVYHLKKPVVIEEIKPVLAHIRNNWRAGDRVYVYAGAQPAFAYYAARYGFKSEDAIPGVSAREQWQRYFDNVDLLRGSRRVWVLFSHVYTWGSASEETVIVFHLDRIGHRLDQYKEVDASAYLYDLQ
jgi:hypothetical protein